MIIILITLLILISLISTYSFLQLYKKYKALNDSYQELSNKYNRLFIDDDQDN